ncbi:Phosphoglycerate dehydrogenase-like oxidoreductase [Corynebacterium camporealensis]|uniref:D-isomer specific 2-hydroxyacid dehydrogenase family protein n=1 Tax=Corynebacterium camporealensis TaxID=161896 RepID=UPI000CF8BD06|nr:D-isomer specific 2-hydroxyacid dehydrogenase family protein [Corynebacterium camporealensis]AVH88830.1 Phosphoglycerate dehydrogenase-like oxidoreductase [Corynebacterium camporealensis]
MKFYMGPEAWEPTVEDIVAAGHEQVERMEDAEVFINTMPNPRKIPQRTENIQWVQHCFTGVNQLIDAGIIADDGIPWCNSAGAFAKPVAEGCLGLLLSQAHHHKAFALAATWDVANELDESQKWIYTQREPQKVAILGAGGIGKQLIKLLKPFGVHITAVNRSGRDVSGADESVAMDKAGHIWSESDVIVNILPLTKETDKLVDAQKFAQMKTSALFINVGRGSTVVTDDLVDALRNSEIAGAGLEVMDPEPLPDGHPLYELPNCTMTPHMAASAGVAQFHMGEVFNANAAAWEKGEEMPTQVDAEAGY